MTEPLYPSFLDSEESLFETAADFFTLIALAAIYAVITFGSNVGGQSFGVGIRQAEGGGIVGTMEANVLYIALEPVGDLMRVTIIDPAGGGMSQHSYEPAEEEPERVVEEIMAKVHDMSGIERVKCRLDRQENRPEVHKIFLLLLRALQSEGLVVDAGV